MKSFQELLDATAALHNHLCPRQVLGVRMGMAAAQHLDLDLPQSDKRVFTLVETDGCFSDGIAVATGCTLGHRTMHLMDFGKIAATFIDTHTQNAIRMTPRPESRDLAAIYAPHAADKWHAYLEAYQIIPDQELFTIQPVILNFSIGSLISTPAARATCEECGEEIFNEREVLIEDRVLCRACAGQRYYELGKIYQPNF